MKLDNVEVSMSRMKRTPSSYPSRQARENVALGSLVMLVALKEDGDIVWPSVKTSEAVHVEVTSAAAGKYVGKVLDTRIDDLTGTDVEFGPENIGTIKPGQLKLK